ncbi:MAG: CoA-binding protein, partial [Clostridiales bacterium]|nr:CoA-binding protein [Clostridiales bacterium]
MSIHKLFYPKGVVVAGSASPGKLGQVLLERLLLAGFPAVFALNPKAIGWGAAPGFVSARQIEAPLDLAVIVSPASTVADVLADCGEAGVRAAIIISSGFGEAGNAEGERQLQEVAARYGISYTGPNCAGLINTGNNLLASLEAAPPPGATSLISQSGAVGGVMMDLAEARGLGLAKFVSYGNGSGVGELDLLAYLANDPETKVIAMYLENIKQGREFLALLRQVTAKKPVVVVKSGRTGSGQRATLSHTGALAGSDQVYDAALAQAGAIRVAGIEDMIDLCQAFSSLSPMKSKKLAIITNSGGPAVLSADRADELGLEVGEPSPACREELASFLPSHAGLANPIDLTVEGDAAAYKQALLA